LDLSIEAERAVGEWTPIFGTVGYIAGDLLRRVVGSGKILPLNDRPANPRSIHRHLTYPILLCSKTIYPGEIFSTTV
jgi:hypothetical protein